MVSHRRLLVFTRYPVPGQVKTRLIPKLGSQGSAALQRRLTEHTAAQARLLQEREGTPWRVVFDGGSLLEMRKWLHHHDCRPQTEGDLGWRMQAAFTEAFAEGDEAVVLVGCDIPEISVSILAAGFERLRKYPVVIGPSRDGGYYLAGCRSPEHRRALPLLFEKMAWSTPEVARLTRQRLRSGGLDYAELPVLQDLDTPDDLVELFPGRNP